MSFKQIDDDEGAAWWAWAVGREAVMVTASSRSATTSKAEAGADL
jgi:CO/xanthine dehydrogenase Mo-binding subunit